MTCQYCAITITATAITCRDCTAYLAYSDNAVTLDAELDRDSGLAYWIQWRRNRGVLAEGVAA